MKRILLFLLFTNVFSTLFSIEVNTKNIKIIRDKFGVPHIYGKTDEEVAYGLAWATAEDDFKSMQENFLTARGRLAEVKGKDGAIMDFVCAVLGARESVEKLYDKSYSPKFKNMLSAYVKACNRYAALHPEKVWIKNAFPVTEKDVVVGYAIGLALMTNVPFSIMKINDGTIENKTLSSPKGSNAFAVNSKKTKDGNTYLGINSHQPLEGPYSWYEAHLHSEEGWNILGGTFPGGVTIFHGANEHLGWAHTVSFADHDDVYALKMHPTDKRKYEFDGKWLVLQERKVKLKVKLFWFIKIPITKKYYESVYGPVLEKEGKFYALRFPSAFDIRGAEQWYHMNKATNLNEFQGALKQMALPGMNIIYADKNDNIMYIDNGHFPRRAKGYDWWHVVPGNTYKTLWKPNDYYGYDSLAKVINPACGYLFNNNNTPFNCTAKEDNLKKETQPLNEYYFAYNDNRALRTSYLFASKGKISYEEFKQIKYDQSFMNPAFNYAMINIEDVLHLDTQKYPHIKEGIDVLKKWNRSADVNNKQAAMVALITKYVIDRLVAEGNFPAVRTRIKEWFLVQCVADAQEHLLKHFGQLEVPLGDMQKLVRGNKELPIGGVPDVNATMWISKHKNGKYKAEAGETYIELIQFTKNGPIIESISPYGTSNVEGNKHYDDQMELFVQQKCKKMSMNLAEIIKEKESEYHPQ
ncbi:MAG TPA: penicillin acylase family protein [Chitinophagales bacterium]|nr:penicillin acylase family protein [Chitinophagales bacterium]HMW13627.1 penicillin acylase family protein [Chitinophagales bacterium]HMX59851.1 penicillin acylase family protein [Chitinophagales bacterium]HMY24055.1 penicillin acylase family protein [Chitinophagales bacterium]HMZ34718.1 penicillin acylase family protein [Chitinophagales bacterium]